MALTLLNTALAASASVRTITADITALQTRLAEEPIRLAAADAALEQELARLDKAIAEEEHRIRQQEALNTTLEKQIQKKRAEADALWAETQRSLGPNATGTLHNLS
jgi:septal ring factor EnvC (AmiA/AmiB activator)